MKQDKKELYESIMASVAKEVKKALNESEISKQDIDNAKAIAYAIMLLLEYAAVDNNVSLAKELYKRNIYPSLDNKVIYTMAQTIMDLLHIN